MKFLISRTRTVTDSVILDVPIPEWMRDKHGNKMLAEFFAKTWEGAWKEDVVEYNRIDARPVDASEPAANEVVETLTDEVHPTVIIQPVVTQIIRRTSRLESWRQSNAAAAFILQRSGWLERKIAT